MDVLEYVNRPDVQRALYEDDEFRQRVLTWIATIAQLKRLRLLPYEQELAAIKQVAETFLPANVSTLNAALDKSRQMLDFQKALLQAALAIRGQNLAAAAQAREAALAERQLALREAALADHELALREAAAMRARGGGGGDEWGGGGGGEGGGDWE